MLYCFCKGLGDANIVSIIEGRAEVFVAISSDVGYRLER
jgi:hypothetical protein